MLPGKTKHEVVSEFRTSEILSAARKVFAEKGFRDATMEAIAEAAGLGKGTLYLYFQSKQDVYLAALMQGVEEISRLSRRSMEEATGAGQKILAFVRTRMGYLEQNRDFFQIYHAEFCNLTHPLERHGDFRRIYLKNLEALESVLRKGMETGELRAVNVSAAASAIYEMVRGVTLGRLLTERETSVEEDTETVFDLAWKGIGAA